MPASWRDARSDDHPLQVRCIGHRQWCVHPMVALGCAEPIGIYTGEPTLIAQLPLPEDDSCYFFIEWKTQVSFEFLV